ncbi:MAG TPA: glycoside hydrolase family 15 protein [Longimicrobiaceae bacterium]|nr:glycoside hydrolase family 15 protein [Longimicrobiaceae bacterium]
MIRRPPDGYLPIADYALIGNLRTAALVGRDGSIDWCCLPELSGPSVFAAVLDARKGGRFSVSPTRYLSTDQRYCGDTCVLETSFVCEGARLTVTDFMPLRGSIIGADDPDTAPEIHRLLRCEGGELEVDVLWSPRFDYARGMPGIAAGPGGFVARSGKSALALGGLPGGAGRVADEGGPVVRARFHMRPGERVALVTRWGDDPGIDPAETDDLLKTTCNVWREWVHDHEEIPTDTWAGSWSGLVTRSELTLKLLTHPDTGAVAAAPTTSLPESIGGPRNWDYRYSWVRDSVFVVQALYALGHADAGYDYLHFLARAAEMGKKQDWSLQIMYGLDGETDLPEICLDHLDGYRGSRPVRIGNAAAHQKQHDTYGELLNGAYELVRRQAEIQPDVWEFLSYLADRACQAWRKPDKGIWEVRGHPRHFTYSKVMVWVALDRAVRLAERRQLSGNVDGWRRSCGIVRDLVLKRGYNAELGAFVQSFGSDVLDASNLLIPQVGFLPANDPRVLGTIDRTLERLTVNGLVYRYFSADGLPGGEGAFGLCTFWLVNALALAGRVDKAREIFEGVLGRANHVGLFAEEIDPHSGEFLGNFPQGFTHLGLVNSALYLAHAEGRKVPWVPQIEETATKAGTQPAGGASGGG